MNDMTIRSVSATVHGRLLLRAGDPRLLLVGFHGYAENAERHLEELVRIPGNEVWTLAAVQALHPFYTRTNEVVASWMTGQDRELAIADNIAYVRSVIASLAPAGLLVFAGFSQGAAMAYRAAAAVPCAALLILGGDLPPDVSAQESVQLPQVLVGRGKRDEWFTDEKLEKDLSFLRRQPHGVVTSVFDGGHEWTDEFRAAAGELLRRVKG